MFETIYKGGKRICPGAPIMGLCKDFFSDLEFAAAVNHPKNYLYTALDVWIFWKSFLALISGTRTETSESRYISCQYLLLVFLDHMNPFDAFFHTSYIRSRL